MATKPRVGGRNWRKAFKAAEDAVAAAEAADIQALRSGSIDLVTYIQALGVILGEIRDWRLLMAELREIAANDPVLNDPALIESD